MNSEIRDPGTQRPRADDDGLETVETDIRQFVTFIAGDEVFAVDMAPVQEIIRVPEVVRVPLAPPTLEGLANLRGRVLPIISLRRIFGFAEHDYDDATRAVVIDIGQPLGFVVDRVASVVGVEPGQIEDVGSIRSTVNTELLSGLIKDVGGHAMIMVLDFAKLIAREFTQIEAIARAGATTGGVYGGAAADEEEKASDELQLVSFTVAGQEYAMDIASVQEIVQVPETIIHVPHSESHVLGVMTLRNRLLPLVSLRRMFALPTQDADDHSRIVVVAVGGSSVGVVMDSVNEVLRVAKAGCRRHARRCWPAKATSPTSPRSAGSKAASGWCRSSRRTTCSAIPPSRRRWKPWTTRMTTQRPGPRRRDDEPPTTTSRSWCSGSTRRSSACRSAASRRSSGSPRSSPTCPRRRASSRA